MPLATHIISTTYMTWPPGDPRGHWSPLLDLYGHLLSRGSKLQLPNPTTLTRATALAKEPPKILTPEELQLIADTFAQHLTLPPANPGAISCFAAALEPTHVHLLLTGMDDATRQQTVGRLKGTSSAALKKLPQNASRTRTWTTSYWHVDLYDHHAFTTIRTYIQNHNTRKNLLPNPYPWITTIPP